MDVAKKLESVGIAVEKYKRGPLGKNPFSMSVKGDAIYLWEGNTNVTVRTDKRKKQCLLTVVEESRTVEENFKQYLSLKDQDIKLGTTYGANDMNKALKLALYDTFIPSRSACRVFVPSSRFSKKFTGASIVYKYGENQLQTNWKLRQKSRKSTLTFLVGFDESTSAKPFICLLKDNPDTFQGAYNSLLPVGVKLHPKHKRQGEWFLNPVHDKLNIELMTHSVLNHKELCKMRLNGARQTGSWNGCSWNGWSKVNLSSHEGVCMRYEGKLYAIGEVKDVRKGRHEPVYLDRFHEVIRNNEAVQPEQNVRMWD